MGNVVSITEYFQLATGGVVHAGYVDAADEAVALCGKTRAASTATFMPITAAGATCKSCIKSMPLEDLKANTTQILQTVARQRQEARGSRIERDHAEALTMDHEVTERGSWTPRAVAAVRDTDEQDQMVSGYTMAVTRMIVREGGYTVHEASDMATEYQAMIDKGERFGSNIDYVAWEIMSARSKAKAALLAEIEAHQAAILTDTREKGALPGAQASELAALPPVETQVAEIRRTLTDGAKDLDSFLHSLEPVDPWAALRSKRKATKVTRRALQSKLNRKGR